MTMLGKLAILAVFCGMIIGLGLVLSEDQPEDQDDE